MTTLTKLQLTLLSSAATRPDGSLLPAPVDLDVAPNRVRKAVGQLVDLALADQRQVVEQPLSWRANGDNLFGAFINGAGRQQLVSSEPEAPSPAPARQTKTHLLIDLLSRPNGASIVEVIAATGWQAHTARAAITVLKSKGGHLVDRFGERGSSRYRIGEAR